MMMKMVRRSSLLQATLCVMLAAATHAQEPSRSLDLFSSSADTVLRHNAASVLFERNLNTFNWIGSVRLDTSALGTRLRLDDLLLSNIILLEATPTATEQRLQSTQHRLRLHLSTPITNEVSVTGQWASLNYSDKKAVGLSSASINSVLAGIEYTPIPLFTIAPSIGHRWDNQIDVRDRGLSYTLAARTNPVAFDDYHIVGSAQFQQDRLDPRLLEQHFARFGFQKSFIGRTRDSLDAGFAHSRREFYTSQASALESRIENIVSFGNLLEYEFDPTFLSSFFLAVSNRMLDKDYRALQSFAIAPAQYNTGIEEFRLETFVQALYRDDQSGVAVSARLGYSERNERHFAKNPTTGFFRDSTEVLLGERAAQEQERTKDNLTRRTSFAGTVDVALSRSDRLTLSGAASILRYDTPSAANVEDRDEQLLALSLSTRHTLSRYLELSFTLDGTLSHIVYLLRDRSANNNINRVLRFAPRTFYKPASFLSSMNTFEVLANYTVYDFEQQAAQVRSFSYRQFGWIDSTSFEVTDRIELDFFLYLKLYERGQLNWQEFSERRENSFVDKTYAVQVRFAPEEEVLFAAGLRYFSQTRYSYSGTTRKLDSFLRSVGPTCMILWRPHRKGEVMMNGWYEQRRLEGGGVRSLANMTLTVTLTI
ncbi:MAG: hypothetical protein C4326_04125 [Ignavibacteria bacterium]